MTRWLNNTKQRDLFQFHCTALGHLLPGATNADLEHSCTTVKALGETPFAEFLCQQHLAPLWDERLGHYPDRLPVSAEFTKLIHEARLHATGAYLMQRHYLARVRDILDAAGVTHVVIKGAHTREVYYDTPALRPALDIDVLFKPEDRLKAIRALQSGGFSFHGLPETISHECGLIKGNTCIDLHWDIMRPGRTREPMVDALLDSRVDYGSHWGPGHGETLFLMLVHPVFTKYSTTPYARLVRLVDLAQLLHRHPGSVEHALPLLRAAGLATAGWITSTWLDLLAPGIGAGALAAKIEPGRLRRTYLRRWLANNLSTRLLGSPLLIQLGFTLLAHDTPRDALRAVMQSRRHGQAAARTLAETQTQILSTPATAP